MTTDSERTTPKRRRKKPERFVDLQVHTCFSDGIFTPTEVVKLAAAAKLKAVGITDHDTIDGIPEALAQGTRSRIEVIPGVEIGAKFSGGTLDILGYFIDIASPTIESSLRWLRERRHERNPHIIEKLHDLGVQIDYDEVLEMADGGSVGRPHIARVIVAKGYAQSVEEAFSRYLARNAPAYVPKERLTSAQVIGLIRNAGGVPVLAHPTTLNVGVNERLDVVVAGLVREGLLGIEVMCSGYESFTTISLTHIAEKHNLLMTGGSDFHGDSNSHVQIGTGTGDLRVPYKYVEHLQAAATSLRRRSAPELVMG